MKKIGLICLAVVLALGALGVGYAMWSDTVVVTETVESGQLYAEWISCYCQDKGNDPNPDNTDKGKDVGSTLCEIDSVDPRILHVTVDNAYPCYWNDCQVEFRNTGTVPYIISSVNILNPNFKLATGYGNNDGPVWVELADGVGSQCDPGVPAGSSLKFHVEQCAEEGHQYTFDVEIEVVQWNKY